VRQALVDLELRTRHQLGRQQGRIGDRHDLVVVAVHDEVGTSIFFRSSVKSVSENALTQS
jgi:hypothetical protein